MTFAPSTFRFSMACGVAGAFVDISDYVLFDEGFITRSWGRQDAFSDTNPGSFSFTLNNADGRFTPGNSASPLATKVAEGMAVCWELNGQLRHGTIRSIPIVFPVVGKPSTMRLRLVVADDLQFLARNSIVALSESMVIGAPAYFYWPLSDAVDSVSAAEVSGNGGPSLVVDTAEAFWTPKFGYPDSPASGSTQLEANVATNPLVYILGATTFTTVNYAAGSMGSWGVWITPLSAPFGRFDFAVRAAGLTSAIRFGLDSVSNYYYATAGLSAAIVGPAPELDVPAYLAVRVTTTGSTTITVEFFVNGVSYGSSVYTQGTAVGALTNAQRTPVLANLYFGGSGGRAHYAVGSLSHTAVLVDETNVFESTVAERIAAIMTTTPEVTPAALPSDLSTTTVGAFTNGVTALDALHTILRGEQGHIYTTATGTYTAPVPQVVIRSRTRPETVTATFSITEDIDGAPNIGMDNSNTVSTLIVNGPSQDVRLTDASLFDRVGSANRNEEVPYVNAGDLRLFGEDRFVRMTRDSVDVFSIEINARNTTTNRWNDLVALVPGLRYRVTGLPQTQLGFATWDGWLLGGDELHTADENRFTLYFERCLPDTGIFDTDRFMAGGDLTLSAGVSAVATSLSVATTGATFTTSGADLPLTIEVDLEQMTVTACTSATPQVMTVVRGVNGTTAATHAAGALVDLADETLFAY